MINNLSTKYCQKSKGRLQKIFAKSIKTFLQKKKKNSNIVANDIKTFLNMKNKGKLNIGKIILKCKKMFLFKCI